MTIQDELRKAREALKISPSELARRAGIHRSLIHKIEAGGNLTVDTLLKVAEQLPNLELLDFGSKKVRFGGHPTELHAVVADHVQAAAALTAASTALAEASQRLAGTSTRLLVLLAATAPADTSPTELADWLPTEEDVSPDQAERIRRLDASVDAGAPLVDTEE